MALISASFKLVNTVICCLPHLAARRIDQVRNLGKRKETDTQRQCQRWKCDVPAGQVGDDPEHKLDVLERTKQQQVAGNSQPKPVAPLPVRGDDPAADPKVEADAAEHHRK